ncbi:MAG: hypothetical protein OXR67_06345 [Chloroflexota bacterium]|nr:hypothetical protein [Chloroflexota bacterium]
MPTCRTSSKRIIQTPDSPLGSGGEAVVYAVNDQPDLVAKIYTKDIPTGPTPTALWKRKEQKLAAMIENAPPTRDADNNVALAWPEEILWYYGGPFDGLMAGFTMPKIDMGLYKDILNYYNPAKRRELNATLARQDLRVPTDGEDLETLLNVVVRNILTILGNIHRLGYVIGDVNESNILVNYEGRVAFVDSDSFQVQDKKNRTVHRSPVGKPDFLSPRVIGLTADDCNQDRCPSGKPRGRHKKEFLCFDRLAEDDNFAIAVILFKLLMNGVHPLDNIGGSQTYKERIANREFPFHHPTLSTPARSKERWEQLSPNWMNYFGHTFAGGRSYSAAEVLNLGHHLASKGGNNLGQQATVNYSTTISGAGNNTGNSSSNQAAQQQQNPSAPHHTQSRQQTPMGPRNRQNRQQTPEATRNRQAQPIVRLVSCPQCGMDNQDTKIVCQNPNCLAYLSQKTSPCRSCGTEIPDNFQCCPRCGPP